MSLNGIHFDTFEENTQIIVQPKETIEHKTVVSQNKTIYAQPDLTANCIKVQSTGSKEYELHCEEK